METQDLLETIEDKKKNLQNYRFHQLKKAIARLDQLQDTNDKNILEHQISKDLKMAKREME